MIRDEESINREMLLVHELALNARYMFNNLLYAAYREVIDLLCIELAETRRINKEKP